MKMKTYKRHRWGFIGDGSFISVTEQCKRCGLLRHNLDVPDGRGGIKWVNIYSDEIEGDNWERHNKVPPCSVGVS